MYASPFPTLLENVTKLAQKIINYLFRKYKYCWVINKCTCMNFKDSGLQKCDSFHFRVVLQEIFSGKYSWVLSLVSNLLLTHLYIFSFMSWKKLYVCIFGTKEEWRIECFYHLVSPSCAEALEWPWGHRVHSHASFATSWHCDFGSHFTSQASVC